MPAATAPPPGRPWWRRKRAWAAIALLSVAAYPACVGPLFYACGRGWIPGWACDAVNRPLGPLWPSGASGRPTPFSRYVMWWVFLSGRHRDGAN